MAYDDPSVIQPQEDETEDQKNKILQQIGLHPSQIAVQQHLGLKENPTLPTEPGPLENLGGNNPSSGSSPLIPSLSSGGGASSATPPAAPAESGLIPSPVSKPSLFKTQSDNAEQAIERGQQERDRLIATGSGVSQIKNPLLRTLARIGDVAETAIIPGAAVATPGTELHHQSLIGQADRQINQGELEQQKAQEAKEKEATQAKIEAETEKLIHPAEVYKPVPGFETTKGNPVLYGEHKGDFKFASPDDETMQHVPPKPTAGQESLGNVDSLNKVNESLWQQLNPGQALPQDFKLPPNATQKDYDHVKQALDFSINLANKRGQETQANALRQMAEGLKQQALALSKDKEGMKMVMGYDKSGHQIATSVDDAKRLGLERSTEVGAQQKEKIDNARALLPLFNSNDPNDPGLMQMVETLDKKGKLGTLASRWNEILTGQVGAGDPDFEAFRTKWNLGTTALMNVHVGNRGGAYLMEHFEDAVNAKKMNADILRSGFKTEYNYIKHRALLPPDLVPSNERPAPGTTPPKSGSAEKTNFTPPSGTVPFKDNKGVIYDIPLDKSKDQDFIKRNGLTPLTVPKTEPKKEAPRKTSEANPPSLFGPTSAGGKNF